MTKHKKKQDNGNNPPEELFEFELEFCFKKSAYMKAYNEGGELWQINHKKHLFLLHKIVNTAAGRIAIMNDAKAIVGVFVSDKDSFLNCFDKEELTKEEMQYLEELSF